MIGVVQTAQVLAEHDLSNVELQVDWSEPIYHQDFYHNYPKYVLIKKKPNLLFF